MNAVTFLLVYAVTLSWLAPVLLPGRSAGSVRPVLAVAAWMGAIVTCLGAWLAALVILVVGLVHSVVDRTALTFCVQALGIAPTMHLPAPLAVALVVTLIIVTGSVALHTARRVIVTLASSRRTNRDHAEAMNIVGRATSQRGVVMVEAAEPVAYCVAGGRRSLIVVTSEALRRLDDAGLNAVLAHERAHLRGRHNQIVAVLTALAGALPRMPLIAAAVRTVPALLEMCADDSAIRLTDRRQVLRSLVLLSTGGRVPDGMLAAGGTAVLDRVERLIEPGGRSSGRVGDLALAVSTVATCAGPFFAAMLCVL
jgi:beta-lactamase regulating signal transducer with metallopeptidase domain